MNGRSLPHRTFLRTWGRLASVSLVVVVGTVFATGGGPAVAAPNFSVSPTTLSFPSTFVNASSTIVVTVTNLTGTTRTPNFSGGAPNDAANFGGSQNCAGVPLAPGGTCQFAYTFEPSSAGPHASATSIGVDAENFFLSMSGTAVAPITVSRRRWCSPTRWSARPRRSRWW